MSEEPIDGNDHELTAAYLYGRGDANEFIRKQQQEIEQLRAELAFLHSQFQMHSPKMDGQHSWRFRNSGWPMTHAKGPTVEAAIQAAMTEVAREQQAAEGGHA